MTLPIGAKLGRYEIRSQIGAGGMGEVYRAFDTELDRTVAIKILPEDLASDQQRLQRFIQEAKAASALNHPHILTIYDIGATGNSRFIAAELIEGDTLRQRIAEGMKLADSLEVSIQIASALAAAHAEGIIHRDVKPENVMIRRDGYIKLLDFGLAKLTDPGLSSTDTAALTKAMVNTGAGIVMGTANYMSPEQAKGVSVDARTDLWSLGAVLYEMTTGRLPFPGETPTETISLILQREPAPLGRYGGDLPPELERIVTKALTKDREERYQTARDMLIDLRNLKRKLDANVEIERGAAPELRAAGTTTGGGGAAGTTSGTTSTARGGAAQTVSSAEYIVSAVGRHKLAALIALVVTVAGAIGLRAYLHARDTEVEIESIAVLPFENQDHDADVDWISDGLTESIINSLTQLPRLKVISRSSAFRYKGKDTNPLAAGKELGVRAVLTGRTMQRGENLTISTELVDVRDDKQLWGEQYIEKLADLMSLQREIAAKITSNLRLRLSGEERDRMVKHNTNNGEAYQLYLKGRYYWNKRTGEGLKKSIEYFQQAIDVDPAYALAYSGLSDAYILLAGYGADSPQNSYPKAKAAAERALAIDDSLAEAHCSLAQVLAVFDWNFPGSDKEFRRAIELNPNYPTAHHWYGNDTLLVMGRLEEAIAEGRRAEQLDPLSAIISADLGSDLTYARRYDEAIAQLRKTEELDQNFSYTYVALGLAYDLKGMHQEAIAEYQKAKQLNGDPSLLAYMAYSYGVMGRKDEALKLIDQVKEISKQQYISGYIIAVAYIGLGDNDQALAWLEKNFKDHEETILFLKVDPMLDPIRTDPRFADLVRRVGL